MKHKLWLNCLSLILIAGVSACKKSTVEDVETAQSAVKIENVAASANQTTLFQGPTDPYDRDPENDTKEGARMLERERIYSGKLATNTDVDYYALKDNCQTTRFEIIGNKNIAVTIILGDGRTIFVKERTFSFFAAKGIKAWIKVELDKDWKLNGNKVPAETIQQLKSQKGVTWEYKEWSPNNADYQINTGSPKA